MNFDELKKQWDNQSSDEVNIDSDLEKLKSANTILAKVRTRVKIDFVGYLLVSMLFIVLGFLYWFEKSSVEKLSMIMLIIQFIVFGILCYRRFYYFYRSSSPKNISTKENLIKIFYELKFAIDTYKIAIFTVVPLGFLYIVFIKPNDNIDEIIRFFDELFRQPFYLIIFIVLTSISIIIFWFCISIPINITYKPYVKQINQILNQLEEE